MTNLIKLKSLKKCVCIEWILKTSICHKYVSEPFFFQSRQCKLEFYVGDYDLEPFFFSTLKFNGELHWPVIFSVRIVSGSSILSAQTTESAKYGGIIWTSEGKSGSVNDLLLTIEVFIYADASKKEDKCIQTFMAHLNDDTSAEGLQKDFSDLLNTGLYHDAEIKCGQHSNKVHKLVLCTRSEVFRAMLESHMKEGKTGIINIKDIDDSYIKDFVRYLYTDAMPELTEDKAVVLYEAGDKYNVKSLMYRCSEYLQGNLSAENAFRYYTLADAHSDQKLMNRVKSYILENKIFLQCNYWEPFCENFPKFAVEVYKYSYKKQ